LTLSNKTGSRFNIQPVICFYYFYGQPVLNIVGVITDLQAVICNSILNADRSRIDIAGNISILEQHLTVCINYHLKIISSVVVTNIMDHIIEPDYQAVGSTVIINVSAFDRIQVVPERHDRRTWSIYIGNLSISPLRIIISKTDPAIWIYPELRVVIPIKIEIKSDRH